MVTEAGSLTVHDRLNRLEARHEAGGVCEKDRAEFHEKLNALAERVKALEVKMALVCGVSSAIGAVVGAVIVKLITKG